MKTRPRVVSALFLSAIYLIAAVLPACAQEFWASGLGENRTYFLESFSGTSAVKISPAASSPRVSVLVQLAGMNAEQWNLVQTRIRGLVNATRQTGGLNLYLLSDAGPLSWKQVKNFAQIQPQLKKVSFPDTALPAESAWSQIASNLPEATEKFE